MKKQVLSLLAITLILSCSVFVSAQVGNETNQTNQTDINETTTQTPPYVDPTILPAFENQTWVRMLVRLVDNSNITIQGTNEERWNLSMQKTEFLTSEVQKFVINLSESEIKDIREHTGEFTAYITKEGLDRLSNNPRVKEIILAYMEAGYGATNTSTSENQTPPYIDPEILKAFENNIWVKVSVRYKGDMPITFENEQQMALFYSNSSVAKSFFGYIPETEMRNVQGGLLALQPFFKAEVTGQGFDKLANNSRVTKIFLSKVASISGNESAEEQQLTTNQTEIKTPEITKPKSFFSRIINFFKSLFRKK